MTPVMTWAAAVIPRTLQGADSEQTSPVFHSTFLGFPSSPDPLSSTSPGPSSPRAVPMPPPARRSALDWRPPRRNGIGRVRRHVAGQHVRPGLLGQRDPETHHQPAGRGRGVLRDQDRVVGPEHSILAPQLLRPGPALQETAGVLPWGHEGPVRVSTHRRYEDKAANSQNSHFKSLTGAQLQLMGARRYWGPPCWPPFNFQMFSPWWQLSYNNMLKG